MFTQGWVDFTALGVQGTRRQGKQSIKHSIETLIPFFYNRFFIIMRVAYLHFVKEKTKEKK